MQPEARESANQHYTVCFIYVVVKLSKTLQYLLIGLLTQLNCSSGSAWA